MATGRVPAEYRPRQVGLEGSAFVVLGGVLWVTAGLVGMVIVAVMLVIRLVSSPSYAVAVGALLVVTVAPEVGQSVAPVDDALLVFGGFAILLWSSLVVEWPRRVALAATTALAATVVGLALAGGVGSTAVGIVVVACSYALAAYGLHRYERVRLGLVGGEIDER